MPWIFYLISLFRRASRFIGVLDKSGAENNSPEIFLCIGTKDVQIQALYQCRGQGPKCEYIFQK